MKRNTLLTLIVIILCLGIFYYYNPDKFDLLINSIKNIKNFLLPAKPCVNPIEYSIDTFDQRFGISKAVFISYVEKAENIWEKAIGKNLFQYDSKGSLEINLIYDSRQQMTNELEQQGVAINDGKALYDVLKIKYESLVFLYNSQKIIYENLLSDFEIKQAEYNKQVSYWNARGGAKAKEYAQLEKDRADLEDELVSLNQKQDILNSLSNQINEVVLVLNNIAKELNIKVTVFNKVGSSHGEEFSEGEYISDATGQYINIYQFGDIDQLIRVLEHELGHALGLDHVDDPQAVMYRLNTSQNKALTQADIDALNLVCGE